MPSARRRASTRSRRSRRSPGNPAPRGPRTRRTDPRRGGRPLPPRSSPRTIRPVELHVVLEPDPGTEPEDVERLGRQLGNELRSLDVDDVAAVDGAPPPEGAKSGVVLSLTEWLVTLSGSGGVFVTVIGTL